MRVFNKNITSVLLMLVSLILLIGFNIFWLFKNYNEQKSILKKEVDNSFTKTLSAMQDSLVQEQLKNHDFSSEAKKEPEKGRIFLKKKKQISIKSEGLDKEIKKTLGLLFRDSLKMPRNFSDSLGSSKVSITINSSNKITPDSLKMILGKVTSGIRKKNEGAVIVFQLRSDSVSAFSLGKDSIQKTNGIRISRNFRKRLPNIDLPNSNQDTAKNKSNYVFVLKSDSLKVPEISIKYRLELSKNQIKLPFKVVKYPIETIPLPKSEIMTPKFPSGFPVRNYYAVFSGHVPYLFKKIIPETLFSLFLILITTLSFGIIFRNLQKQKRLTELKNDFISNVTHELKTPISTVSVAIEALSDFNVLKNPEQTKEYLEISKNELGRLSMLVDKVLKMSVFEQKELVLEIQEIDLKKVVESVLLSMKIQFEKLNTNVNFDCIGEDFRLQGDSIHLTNVVYNLLDNALKYQKSFNSISQQERGQGGEVFITLKETINSIELSVKDNGIGIQKEYQKKIFEKFFRVPTGDIHNIKGYGLGLSYVWNVIKNHDGEIKVVSTENEGSEFIINLKKLV